MSNATSNNVQSSASTNGLTPEQDAQRKLEIERLIERLRTESDLKTKKAIRHALRMRGHFGGLNERRSIMRSIIADIVNPPTPVVAEPVKATKRTKKAK